MTENRPSQGQASAELSAQDRTHIWSALCHQATAVDDMIRAQLRVGRKLDDPQQVADAARRDYLMELAGRVRDSSSLALEPEAREEPSAVAKADADTLARVMAKVYEPDLDWDNPTDFDLLDRETLTDSGRRILERMKWSGLTFWHLDDLVLDEFDPAPRPSPEAREVTDAVPDLSRVGPTLRGMVDPEECSFDHHGGCQAHGYLSLKPGEVCPQEEAKQLLSDPTVAKALGLDREVSRG